MSDRPRRSARDLRKDLEAAMSGGAVKPTQPTEPTESTEPTVPTEVIAPTSPAQATKPAEATDPAEVRVGRRRKLGRLYCAPELPGRIDSEQVEVIARIGRMVDKTDLVNALVRVGLAHQDEVIKVLRDGQI